MSETPEQSMTAPDPVEVIARVLWHQMECQNDGCGNCVTHGHWLEEDGTCGTSNGAADEIVKALDLDARDRAAEKRGADRALEANARAWQTKGWSDVLLPGMTNPIAQAQAVTDWLRAQAKGGDQ